MCLLQNLSFILRQQKTKRFQTGKKKKKATLKLTSANNNITDAKNKLERDTNGGRKSRMVAVTGVLD